jgi:DNA-binding transcriptional regulator YdaS (Cro superfamily)
MDLRTYTELLPRGGVASLAALLGVTPVYLSQLSARQDGRVPSAELCVRVEGATERAVRRWDLRPDDWHRIWPELIGTLGAPAVPSAQPQAEAA